MELMIIDNTKNAIEDELLKYATENGILDIETIAKQVEMNKRKNCLKKHPYKIWQGKDEYWYTYLLMKGKRVLKKKKSKEDLENDLIEFYKNQEEIFVKDIFDHWINQKYEYREIQKQTYDRYRTDFIRFFKNSPLYEKDIRKITEEDLEDFIRKNINDKHLSNKAYSGLRLLIIGIFKYAKKHKYTEISITNFFGDLELPKKCFSKKIVLDEDSVFTDEEVEKIYNYIKENESIINYGILLTFQTGLRVGELCTLKYSDIHDNKLSVRRTEIRYKDEDGNYVIEVRESPKTEAGNRDIILNSNAQKTLKEIRRLNPFGEFMFMRNGKRIREKAFGNKIIKICQYVGIKERSMHKARKTYATKLINGGVDESLIIKQMGHTSIDCTKNYYYFNNKSDEEAARQIEKALSY